MLRKFLERNKFVKTAEKIISAAALLVLLYHMIPIEVEKLAQRESKVVVDKNGEILRVFTNFEEQYLLPLQFSAPIPEKLKKAVMLFEDKRFYSHFGIDPVSIMRAVKQNISAGRVKSGASTITMQLARIMKEKPRTVTNKIYEALQAIKIEMNYTKDEIFKLYLNFAPYGGNNFGYHTASYRYFRKSPEKLTWAEASLLAVLPNQPTVLHPGKNTRKLSAKRNRLLKRMWEAGMMDKASYQLALLEKVPDTVYRFSGAAFHLAEKVKKTEKTNLIKTTIDKTIQKQLEDIVLRHSKHLQARGIDNISVIVADTKTGETTAYIGSQNYFDKAKKGMVDGADAPRSSGSILKPFLYALSMDEGLIIPSTQLRDVETYYGTFMPKNADNRYHGIVTAEDSLIRSLNVPAVRLLNLYGIENFYSFLKQAGMTTLFRTAEEYGLPLILGGAEAKLTEVAAMYRALGTMGNFSPLTVLKPNDKVGKTLISRGASRLTLEMLKKLNRPGIENSWNRYNNQWPIAWKTGTSYGQKDAWAAGVTPEWTIAVWAGNFDGRGSSDLGGAISAGPIMFDILNALPKKPENRWFEKPEEDLITIETCPETGFQPSIHCRERTEAEAPKNAKPLRLCPFHTTIHVTNDQKQQVNASCWEENNHKAISFLSYPPEITQHMIENGVPIKELPPFKPGCKATRSINPLRIIYPQMKTIVRIPTDFHAKKQKLVLKAAHRNPKETIFWYMDTKYLGKTQKRHQISVDLMPGEHVLEILDKDDNRKRVRFRVGE